MLLRLLDRVITRGTLVVTWPDGEVTRHGTGLPEAPVRVADEALVRALALRPEMALGEGFMEGRLTTPDLHGLLELLAGNAVAAGHGRFGGIVPRAMLAAKRFNQNHGLRAARSNVAHHSDLSVDLYRLFLDADLQYTCAYWPSEDLTLEAAQAAKKAHIAAKLLLRPGMRVLDIGCGWGGLAITLARDHGARVVGVTLSAAQKAEAEARVRATGLADRVEIRLTDYRDVTETFDRITVVGMLEHVGQPQYATFFRQMRQRLAPDGVALLHTIGRSTPPNVTAPWIGKYIFPGSYTPALSEIARETERAGLVLTDVEVWRGHYARTLQEWRARFEANRAQIEAMHDARFGRMWEYYLTVCEVGFTHLSNVVFQCQITRDPLAVPVTRGYMR